MQNKKMNRMKELAALLNRASEAYYAKDSEIMSNYEYDRLYDELAALERAGTIRELRMQVDFTLQEAYTDGEGRRVRAIRYRADFTYEKVRGDPWTEYNGSFWVLVVEDVKSRATRTKEYIVKRKLMKERFNIDIQEV